MNNFCIAPIYSTRFNMHAMLEIQGKITAEPWVKNLFLGYNASLIFFKLIVKVCNNENNILLILNATNNNDDNLNTTEDSLLF